MDNQARGKKAVELKEEDYQEGDNQVGVRGEENNRAQGGQPLRKDDQGGEEGGKAQGDDHQKGDDQDQEEGGEAQGAQSPRRGRPRPPRRQLPQKGMNQTRKMATKFKEDDHLEGDNQDQEKGGKIQGG